MKTFLECVKVAASVKGLKAPIKTLYFELPQELIKTLEDAADLYATQSNSHKHGVMQGLPELSQPDRDELLDEILKVFYKQGFKIIPPPEVDLSKFIGKSLFEKQGSPTVGREREAPQD